VTPERRNGETEQTAVARQRLDKRMSEETDPQATIDELMFLYAIRSEIL
jgi:hypothetical protein